MKHSISIHGLCKQYPDFSLHDISFHVPAGSIVGMIGENGAGKTTCLKAALGLIKPDSGSITVLEQPVAAGTYVQNSDIGMVMEGCFFHSDFSLPDIHRIMRQLHPRWSSSRFDQLCRRFSLPMDSHKPLRKYSRGMYAKAALAAALAHNPRLLVLDEATSGLDPVARRDILDLLLEFMQNESNSVLFSSHITSDLEKTADYIVFLHKGHIVFQLAMPDLEQRYAVLRCSPQQADTLHGAHIVGTRRTAFSFEVLIDNADHMTPPPNICMERARIDDILTFFQKGCDAV